MKTIKIATRNSPLALWQAEYVRQKLIEVSGGIEIELVGMQTAGDRLLDAPLFAAGGKGLFIKELEYALLNGTADMAVHSMKDVTIDLPEELALAVIMQGEDSRDVLISNNYRTIADIPEGGLLGTSSLRRQSQLRALRADLVLKELRGNVGTRLRKLDAGEYDGIILAAAGIKRLGLEDRIASFISHDDLLPAIGQGAMGIECRADDPDLHKLISPLNHRETAICVKAERAFSRRLYGGCQLPVAAQASIKEDEIRLLGLVARIDGSEIIRAERKGKLAEANAVGISLAETLLEQGAKAILEELIH